MALPDHVARCFSPVFQGSKWRRWLPKIPDWVMGQELSGDAQNRRTMNERDLLVAAGYFKRRWSQLG
jgi:hypothetical protein